MRYLVLLLTSVLFSTSLYAQHESVASNAHRGNSRQTGDQKLIEQILSTKNPAETPAALSELFKRVGIDSLRKLQTSQDDTIALQAAWEEVARTVPEEVGKRGPFRPDRHKLDWFLGFLEGRTHSQAPEWWTRVLLDATANRRYNSLFDLPENKGPDGHSHSLYHSAGMGDIIAPLDTTLSREHGKTILRVGKESVSIPEDLLFNGGTTEDGKPAYVQSV